MTDYPKEGREMTLYMTAGYKISGLANIAGRTVAEYINNNDRDIILYDTESVETQGGETLLISKNHVIWINPGGEYRMPETGRWEKISIKTFNGQVIRGFVDIAGFDRISDYLTTYTDTFYEVYQCAINDKHYDFLLVSVENSIWKEALPKE